MYRWCIAIFTPSYTKMFPSANERFLSLQAARTTSSISLGRMNCASDYPIAREGSWWAFNAMNDRDNFFQPERSWRWWSTRWASIVGKQLRCPLGYNHDPSGVVSKVWYGTFLQHSFTFLRPYCIFHESLISV